MFEFGKVKTTWEIQLIWRVNKSTTPVQLPPCFILLHVFSSVFSPSAAPNTCINLSLQTVYNSFWFHSCILCTGIQAEQSKVWINRGGFTGIEGGTPRPPLFFYCISKNVSASNHLSSGIVHRVGDVLVLQFLRSPFSGFSGSAPGSEQTVFSLFYLFNFLKLTVNRRFNTNCLWYFDTLSSVHWRKFDFNLIQNNGWKRGN